MSKATVILIDDEPDIRELLAISLQRLGIDCLQAGSYSEAQRLITSTRCDLCITDIRMPDGSGIDLVRQFKSLYPTTPIAVMTAYDTTDIAVQAMKAGAFEFLAKPIRATHLQTLINDAGILAPNNDSSVSSLNAEDPSAVSLIGTSISTTKLREGSLKAANSMAPVAIIGEPGTGKELVASSIHSHSQRRLASFVAVDCSAIPSEHTDHEFFGKWAGDSKTGKASPGLFESARGGTLFLNEIDGLPAHFQATLVRALREKKYTPVGANMQIPLEVRISCASSCDLESSVRAGNFREDLFYYLNVIKLETTPLKKRTEDIPLLCEYFLDTLDSKKKNSLSEAALEKLIEHDFPGNVRELKNLLRRAQLMALKEIIEADDLDFSFTNKQDSSDEKNGGLGSADPLEITDLESYLSEVEKKIVLGALEAERWHQTKAAKRLGLTPRQFRYKLSKHRINSDK